MTDTLKQRAQTKKALFKYLLEQVKDKHLAKDEAVQYLKLLDESETGKADANSDDEIAIVGLACRFAEADNKEEYWNNLSLGRCSIREFPDERREALTRLSDEELDLFRGGFLSNVDQFDAEFFGIAPNVAEHMDPYQRLMLEVLVESIQDAGYSHKSLYGKPVGVYIGNDHAHRMVHNYLSFIDLEHRDFNSMTGSWSALLAGRVSYLLNLQGPAQVVDTSCSSGLVALDAGIKAIRNKECESALVGGINLMFLPIQKVVGEVENPDFQVHAFSELASGTVWGEGVASVMLKPLAAAKRDGDSIYGVVMGMAVNSDGASNGITAPSARSQQQVLQQAWQRAGVDPKQLSYVEAHGTGTHLGDPIELKGLTAAFAKHTHKKQFCGLGSVKTNIGHTVAVSGLASLIKVMMSFKHQKLAPSLNFNQPNQYIDFCNSPMYCNTQLQPWSSEQPRLAGISAFGLSGTNCHVVLQEHPLVEPPKRPQDLQLLPVSARSPELLVETINRLLGYLRSEQLTTELQLADVCYTAAMGREHYPYRVAVVAASVGEVISQLKQALINLKSQLGQNSTQGLYFKGNHNESQAELNKQANQLLESSEFSEQTLERLAQLYADGAQLKWPKFFDTAVNNFENNQKNTQDGQAQLSYRRVHLPAEPFVKTPYWFINPEQRIVPSKKRTLADLHAEADTGDTQALYQVARAANSVKSENPEHVGLAEQLVAYVVCDSLGYTNLDIQANFYALGGDSISGTRVVYMLNQMLNIKAELSDILAADSVSDFTTTLIKHRGLSEAIEQLEGHSKPQSASKHEIAVAPVSQYYPLSKAQRRMYLQAELDSQATTYNATAIIELGHTPEQAQEQIWLAQLLKRHESLRTRFVLRENNDSHLSSQQSVQQPMQQIVEDCELIPQWVDLTDSSEETEKLLQTVVDRYVKPFQLTQAPLCRVVYISAAAGRQFMLIDMHHIVADGASVGVFIRDYMQLVAGKSLTQLPLSYKDYAVWEQQSAELNDTDQQSTRQHSIRHWQQRFAKQSSESEQTLSELDTDWPRPVSRDFKGATLHRTLPVSLSEQLQQLAQEQGCSMFVLLVTAYRMLLARYDAGYDLNIGTPVNGRSQPELSSLIGMFVNTLVLRDNIDEQLSFTQQLAQIKANTLQDFDHQDFAYEDVIGLVNIEQPDNRNPLFDICFVLHNQDMALDVEGALQDVAFDAGIAKFDLTLFARQNQGHLELSWEYATALFAVERITGMAEQFERLLQAIVAAPNHSVNQILTTAVTGASSVTGPVSVSHPETHSLSIPHIFSEHAASLNQKTAVSFGQQQLSYAELEQKSNQLAHYLINLGVTPGDKVALWFHPSVTMVESLLAVLKCGAAYVPLDPANPSARTEGILADCEATLLLADEGCSITNRASLSVINPVELDLGSQPLMAPELNISGDDLAYVMYTSGTTGQPKGVLIRHKSVIRVVKDTHYLQLDESDVCLLLANYAFDGCVPDLFGALLNGGQLVIAAKDDVLDPERIAALIERHSVSSMFATTSLCHVLIDQQLQALKPLKQLIFGGEAASVKHMRKALEVLGAGVLINGYGPTESCVFALANVIEHLPDNLHSVPIGEPLNDTEILILDPQLRPVPYGCSGELFIGGAGLAQGYLNQPELTAEKFIDHPFKAGEKLYRSGDKARFNQQGEVLYLGRIDQQVKIRGFRIELSEIEAQLSALAGIKQALVVDVDHAGRKQLAAYLVADTAVSAVAASDATLQVRQQLAEQLPDYMLPEAYVWLDELPLNANGKADRQRLPAPQWQQEQHYQAPNNETEHLLCEIWQSLLAVEQVSVQDHFFRLGGDSILCIQLVSQLREAGFSLQVKDVYSAPVLQQLASWLLEQGSDSHVQAEQGLLTGQFPLAPQQQWLFAQSPSQHHRNQVMMWRVPGSATQLDWPQLIQQLAAQHDMLRCVITAPKKSEKQSEKQGEVGGIQAYLAASECSLPVLQRADVSQLTEQQLQQQLIAWQHDVNLAPGLLWQLALLTGFDDGSAQLFFVGHQLICDQTSCEVIAEDLNSLIAGDSLLEKSVSYRQWLPELLAYATHSDEINYWRQACLPVSTLTAAPVSEQADSIQWAVAQPLSEQLLKQANLGYHTQCQDLLITAVARSLSVLTEQQQHSLMIDNPKRIELEHLDNTRTVGNFTASYPVTLSVKGELAEGLIAVKETLRAVPKQGTGFAVLCDLSDSEGLAGCSPPVVSFSYQATSGSSEIALPDQGCAEALASGNVASGDVATDLLAIQVTEVQGKLLFSVVSQLSVEITKQFVEQLQLNLQALAELGISVAQSGGVQTPSDVSSTGLSMQRLQKIQAQITSPRAQETAEIERPVAPKKKKNRIKI